MANDQEFDAPLDEEMTDGLIELTDENGETTQFEFLDIVEYEGQEYVLLMLLGEEEQDDEEGEVVIMRIETDPESGEEIYVSVDDDAIGEAVFNLFLAKMEEEDDE